MKNIFEGQYDRYRFKAIFLIGPPAAGKTEFYNSVLKHKFLKHLDADKVLEFLIKKQGGDLKDTGNYTKWQNSVKKKIEILAKTYREGGLGIVIDGTGKNLQHIKKIKKELENHNYETIMIYINTSLDKSIENSKKRERGVDVDYIKNVYNILKKNVIEYKKLFSSFIEMRVGDDFKKVEKIIDRWLER